MPSTFDFYPEVKKLADSLHKGGNTSEGLQLLRALSELVLTGDRERVDEILGKHWNPDLENDADANTTSCGSRFAWQVSLLCVYART